MTCQFILVFHLVFSIHVVSATHPHIMDIRIEHSKFVFFNEEQRNEIEFFFDIVPSKLLVASDPLMSHMALNDTYIGIYHVLLF